MADSTSIEWTRSEDGTPGATWNPVTGCTEVSDGCDNCYAKTFAERWRGKKGHHFENGFDIALRPERLQLPLRWRRPRRVFVNSMSDLFHPGILDAYIVDVFAMMAITPQHTYQVLTKRHGRMTSLLNQSEFWYRVGRQARHLGYGQNGRAAHCFADGRNIYDLTVWEQLRHLDNCWLGVSVEDQKWAEIRVPALLGTPAAVRFLSCEPLLGPVWISDYVWRLCLCCDGEGHDEACARCAGSGCESGHIRQLDWVIVGGESGRRARPMHPDWARSLRDQCTEDRVPFFMKQWGEHAPEDHGHDRGAITLIDTQGRSWNRTEAGAPPGAVRMRRVGKGAAGRLLDGVSHGAAPRPAR
ncbi:DUF5131 family protein [Streptomyces umbrinus]